MAFSNSHSPGSRNLIMSRDGSRLFWQGFVFDSDLNEIGKLDDEIYATTLHGDLAFTSTSIVSKYSVSVSRR